MVNIHSRDVNAHQAPTQPALLRSRGGEGQHLEQHLHMQTALTNVGQHRELHPQCIHLHRKQDCSWEDALDCGDQSLTSQADWPGACLLSHLSLVHPKLNSSCTWISFLLSPHGYPCFFLALLLVFLSPYSSIPRLPQYFGPYIELLIQFSRLCWPFQVVLTQKIWYFPFRALWCLVIAHVSLP